MAPSGLVGIVDLNLHVAGQHLRVLEHALEFVHRAGRHAEFSSPASHSAEVFRFVTSNSSG